MCGTILMKGLIIMTYEEALEYIHSIPKFTRPLGNAQLARLLDAAGNPQDRLKFIHIAGTNGKGSAAAMLTEILKRSGYKTGMYTSPFLEVFNERMQINGTLIADEELAEYTERVKKLMEENKAYVSEFAFITAIAFLYFYEHNCDVVVLETGMGGKLDATNIITTPILCILTSISYDHMQYLGNTIEEIALEKCGIIKEGIPVVSYPNNDVLDIIRASARDKNAKLVFSSVPERIDNGIVYKGKEYKLSLKGEYQQMNAALVLEAAEILKENGYKLTDEIIKDALNNTSWNARYEFLSDNLILDGAHNIDGVRALVRSLKADGRKVIAVTAMMEDKSFAQCMSEISACAEKVYCTQLEIPRCAKAKTIAKLCGEKGVIYKEPVSALKNALAEADENSLVCVCGSLFLAGYIRKYINEKGCH